MTMEMYLECAEGLGVGEVFLCWSEHLGLILGR